LFPDVHFELWLARVSFRYPGQVRYALQDVSVVAPPGSVVALSGGSGAGKSTLLRLCARELESGASQLTLDSAPLGSIDNDTFWQRIGYVAQNSHVFSGTLRDNLLLSCPDASEADLWAVLDVVGLADRSAPAGRLGHTGRRRG